MFNATVVFDVGIAINVERSMRLRHRSSHYTKLWMTVTCCAMQLPSSTAVAQFKFDELQRKRTQIVHIIHRFFRKVSDGTIFPHIENPLSALGPTNAPKSLCCMFESGIGLEFCTKRVVSRHHHKSLRRSDHSNPNKLDSGHHQTNTIHGTLKHETPTLKLGHMTLVPMKYFVTDDVNRSMRFRKRNLQKRSLGRRNVLSRVSYT